MTGQREVGPLEGGTGWALVTGVGMGAFVDLRAFGQRGKEEVGHDLEWGVPKGWSLPMRELGVVENWGGGGTRIGGGVYVSKNA